MSWLLAFGGFAILIILHEFGHFAAAKAVGMRVERFALFFPPMLFKVRRGETEYGVGAIPLGGYVRISGMSPHEQIPPEHAHRAYLRQPVWKRIVVIAAGPGMNVLIAFVLLWGVLVVHGQGKPEIRDVAPGQPAANVLRPGDVILSVDGSTDLRGDAVAKRIASHRCPGPAVAGCEASTPARLQVRRDGQRVEVAATPRYDPVVERTRLGFTVRAEPAYVRLGPLKAAGESVSTMWFVTKGTLGVFARLLDSKQRKQLSGVVGSYETTRQAFTINPSTAVGLLAFISLSLAIVNLFPFLPLDGGHIFWALAEKVRGRAIPFGIIERSSMVGFALVILLFVIGLSNDIDRLRGAGFGIQR